MNTASLESLTQLLSNNTSVSVDLPPKEKLSTKKNLDKDAIWDEDEIVEAVDVDPRPSPEYVYSNLMIGMI